MTPSPVYRSSSIKRKRRTKQELQAILDACRSIIAEEKGTITIRHLFYRLVALKLLEKTEREYDKLSGYLMKWRRSREIPWTAFADNTRWYYGGRTYAGLTAALENTANTYRRDLWSSQEVYVEIWTEKDAMASILLDTADTFGIRVFPLHGFSSGTALHNAASNFEAIIDGGKDVYVYYFGDYDPSGLDIDRSAMRNLREDHGVEINFKRIAVHEDHIRLYNLPTRPPKEKDSRTRNFRGEAVEIDAMPIDVIRGMVENCIIQHIDPDLWFREKHTPLLES